MGTCIICGASCDGRVCELHEEDVVFLFRGTEPDELTPRRYYQGTIDGYAEFGIFVNIGDRVTGLLHKSELDRRLDSVDLEPGDTVFVQVQNIRDNGNVDLGWSIRQEQNRFRGALIDDPDEGEKLLEGDSDSTDETAETASDESTESSGIGEPEPVSSTSDQQDKSEQKEAEADEQHEESRQDEPESDVTEESTADSSPTFEQATVDQLEDLVGKRVRLEGEIESARQTSGPTVFELRDETGTVECAAFEEAGVRAYPDIDKGDVVRLEGEVERRRGDIQVETEALVSLEADEREEVTERMREAVVERARPGEFEPLAEDAVIESVSEEIRDVATAIRRAVIEGRPIVVRHAATADGYTASAALERATLPLIRDEHDSAEAEYHYFDRRPLEGSVYDMNDATKDVTNMLQNRNRHGETLPLFVFVGAGGSAESIDGFDLLGTYDARRVVIDEREIEEGVAEAVDLLLSPDGETTATVLGATVAAQINPGVRKDLSHLPAISFWEGAPTQYRDLATEAGYSEEDTRTLREAITLEAFYQSYEDKRELIADLLFADEATDPVGLAGHISEQFRTRLETEVETATANLESHEIGGETILVLDTASYTHEYEFPPEPLLLEELFRRHRDEAAALLGVGEDEAYIRSERAVDVRAVAEAAREQAPEAAIDVRGSRDGRIGYLVGEREAARDALLEALSSELSSLAAA